MERLDRLVWIQVARGFSAADILQGRKVCRVFDRRIYRALEAEDIRYHRMASVEILIRRLLSLDYLLEHPD